MRQTTWRRPTKYGQPTNRAAWLALCFLVACCSSALTNRAHAAGISFYDVVSGAFVNVFDPTLSGGDFNGQSLSDLSINDIAGIRDSNASNLALLGPSGISFYNVITGAFVAAFDPTLSGGDFSGQSLSSLASGDIAGIRDSNSSNLILRGPSGMSFYNVVTGGFVAAFDPILSGGDFAGQSLSSLAAGDVAGIRDSNASNLALHGPSGVGFYNVVTGGFVAAFDPTLSGGDFAGQSPSGLASSAIAGIRDANGNNLVLYFSPAPIPEPSSIMLGALAMLGLAAWKCRYPAHWR